MPHGWRWVLCPIDMQWKCSPLKAVGLPLIPMAVFQLGCGMSDCLVYLSFFVLFFSYCCEKYHDQKQFGKVLFHLAVHHKGKSGQELKAGPKAAIMEECYCLAQFVLCIYRGPPAKGWRYPQWAGPSVSIINQENAPQVCLQPSVVGDSFSWSSLFSDDSSLC